MLRRALHVAALLAWAAVVAQAASLPEATARNAALLRELDLWAQMLSAGRRLDAGVLASLVEVKSSYRSPSDTVVHSPAVALDEGATEPLWVEDSHARAATFLVSGGIRRRRKLEAVRKRDLRKAVVSPWNQGSLSSPVAFLQQSEAAGAHEGPAVRYKDVRWTEDGEWRAAYANGDLSTDLGDTHPGMATGGGAGAEEEDVFGADDAPSDSALPDTGSSDDKPAGSAHELSAEFEKLLKMREEAGAPTYRTTMARAREVSASTCPSRALRCLEQCHGNVTACNMEASNGNSELQRPSAGPADDAANFKKRGIPTLKAGQRIEFGTRPGDGKQFRFRESPYGRSPTNHVFKLRLPKTPECGKMRLRVRKHCGDTEERGCALPFESFLPADRHDLREGWFGEEGGERTITWVEENAFTYRLPTPGFDCGCERHPNWDARIEAVADWFVEVSDMRQLGREEAKHFIEKMWDATNMTEIEAEVLTRAELAHRLVEGRVRVDTASWTPAESGFLPIRLQNKFGLPAGSVARSLVPRGAAIHLGRVRCHPLFPALPLPETTDAGAWAPTVVTALNGVPFLCNASAFFEANEPPVGSETVQDPVAGLSDALERGPKRARRVKKVAGGEAVLPPDERRAGVHTISEDEVSGNFLVVAEGARRGGGPRGSVSGLGSRLHGTHGSSGSLHGDAVAVRRADDSQSHPVHRENNESGDGTWATVAGPATLLDEGLALHPQQLSAKSPEVPNECRVTLEIRAFPVCGLHGTYQHKPGLYRCQCSQGWKGAYTVEGESPQATRVVKYGCSERVVADGSQSEDLPARGSGSDGAGDSDGPCHKPLAEMDDGESVACRGRHKDGSPVEPPPVNPNFEKQKRESLERSLEWEERNLRACASCMGVD